MDIFLQIWGGTFYLTNKILFSVAEGLSAEKKRRLKIGGWAIYILGVPAWVLILISDKNWIAAAVEAGGLPSMLLGLFYVYRQIKTPQVWKERIVSSLTYLALTLGIGASIIHNSGLNSLSQILEIGVTVGFLLGSFFLAREKIIGWVFFMLMNISTAALMFVQSNWILVGQQLISLCFVCAGFIQVTRKRPEIESDA